jgi:hypothetical protein
MAGIPFKQEEIKQGVLALKFPPETHEIDYTNLHKDIQNLEELNISQINNDNWDTNFLGTGNSVIEAQFGASSRSLDLPQKWK